MPLRIPCIDADGTYKILCLQDCYNVNQLTWTSGDTIDTYDSQGAEWQFWLVMLNLTHKTWLQKRFGLLAPTEGDASGGTESGSVDFGTPV